MGQAKARGTKEQRVVEGIEKAKLRELAHREEIAARKRKDAEWLASLTEQERANILAKRAFLNKIMSGFGNLDLI